MSIVDKTDASSPSRKPNMSNKNRESGARRATDLREERASQHTEIFKNMAIAATDFAKSAKSVAIVRLLSSYYSFTPLEWDGLASEEKFRFYQIAGNKAGCNVAWTFNISDGQRKKWEADSRFKNLTDAFSQMIIKPVKDNIRNNFNRLPSIWHVIESDKPTDNLYADSEYQPRRFGAHGAINLSSLDELEEFERFLTSKIDKKANNREYVIKLRPIGGFNDEVVDELWWRWFLEENKKPEWKRNPKISRYNKEYTSTGWFLYSTKAVPKTVTVHKDVCGIKPYGTTQDLQAAGKILYNNVRAVAAAIPTSFLAKTTNLLDTVITELPSAHNLRATEAAIHAIDYSLFVSRSVPTNADATGAPLAASARSLAGHIASISRACQRSS